MTTGSRNKIVCFFGLQSSNPPKKSQQQKKKSMFLTNMATLKGEILMFIAIKHRRIIPSFLFLPCFFHFLRLICQTVFGLLN